MGAPRGWGCAGAPLPFPRPRTLPPPFLLLLLVVLGGVFSAQLRVEQLRAAPLLRVASFLFILRLLVVFHLFGVFSGAAAPRRYCLRAGAGRGSPAAGRGWRPRCRGDARGRAPLCPRLCRGHAPAWPPASLHAGIADIPVGTPLQARRQNFVSQLIARKVTGDSYQEPPATRWCWCVSPLGLGGLWCHSEDHCRGVYFMRSLCCLKI